MMLNIRGMSIAENFLKRVKSSRPVSPRMVSPPALDGHSMDGSSHAITPQPLSNVVSCLVGPGPSQNRACAIYAHGSSHGHFTEKANRLTLIRGFGRGKRFSISLNFSQLRQFFLPRRLSHLNSNFFTASPNRTIPRRLSVTP